MRKGIVLSLVLVGALGACGRSASRSPAPVAAAPVASQGCDAMAAHAAAVQARNDDAMRPRLVQLFGQRCVADAWSPAMIDCMNRASLQTMDACAELLTDAQVAAFVEHGDRMLDELDAAEDPH